MTDIPAPTRGVPLFKKCPAFFDCQRGERSQIFFSPFSAIKVKKIALVKTDLYQFSRDNFFQEHTLSLLIGTLLNNRHVNQ
ncbi:hypothetical protein [Bartonella apihabitans]|uniref:hypothetical protein n=1 Tax=Bartonella apihabitans TaxID=2750929 RepID=UPI003BB7CDCA